MANNYTVSNVTTLENSGDTVANGTIVSPVYLYITPNTGYVIQASDFAIGSGGFPPEVVSVVFSDTTTALDVTNLIKVTIELATWYVHGSSAFTMAIDIDGRTHNAKSRLNFATVNTTVTNTTQVLTATNKTATTSGSTVTNTCFLDIQQNTNALIASFVYTAATSFHLTEIPYYQILSNNSARWSSVASDQVYNSDNQLKSIKYSFYYDMGESTVPLSDGETIVFDTPKIAADRVTCINISSIYVDGHNESSVLIASEHDLILNVIGTDNATYNIKVEDQLGLTYDFKTNLFTSSGSPFSSNQTIFNRSRQIALGRFPNRNTHVITIPENTFEATTYTITVTPTGSTFSSLDCSSLEPLQITLRQFGEVDYVFTTSPDDFGVNAANSTIKSILNKVPLEVMFNENQTDAELFYNQEGYFNFSQILGYTVTGTVNSASSTSITLTATANSLKLQVGDKVTGTNIGTSRTITTIADGDANVIVLSGVDGTAQGDLVFTRTVGITRQPNAYLDIKSSAPIVAYYSSLYHGVLQFQVLKTMVNSTIIPAISSDNDYSFANDLVVGMTVSGQDIVGFPTVVSFSSGANNEGVIVLSTAQNLPLRSTLFFAVAESSLYVTQFNITGAGTTACTLNIEGWIERMGNVDVATEVCLSNFISVYEAPTITASTETAVLGKTIKIRPLDTDTSRGQKLIITEITSEGNARAVSISADGQEIKYLAPLSGTSDTITYKISDGISAETSAANIVITLTR